MDLTGPVRPWPERLVARFGAALEWSLRTTTWWRSPSPGGEPALLDRLGELFDVPADRTVVTGGVRHFAGDRAARHTAALLVEHPTFVDIPEIFAARGQQVRPFGWDALGTLPDSKPGAAALWLTSPYRNPDGRSLDHDSTKTVEEFADRGGTVFANQVYGWFTPDGRPPPAPRGAWTVTSLAKLAGGGARLGWATAPPGVAPYTGLVLTGAPPAAWQHAWASFLDGPTYRTLRQHCVEPTLEARRAFTRRMVDTVGWSITGGGMSLLLACAGVTEDEAVDLLARGGLRVSPGRDFASPVPAVRLAFSGVTAAEADRAARLLTGLTGQLRPAEL